MTTTLRPQAASPLTPPHGAEAQRAGPGPVALAPGTAPAATPLLDRWKVAALLVVLLALAASFTALWNGFTYDDLAIVQKNPRVHTLEGWWRFFRQAYWPPPVSGGLYRPIAILGFAVQWKLGGGSPAFFHATSLALYVATSLGVYWLARQLLSPRGALVAAALFAVHPVHVEVVANVVGQAELLAGLAAILATAAYIRARRASLVSGGRLGDRSALAICAIYALGAWSKEHGLFIPALLAIAELWAVDDRRSWRARLAGTWRLWVALGVIGVGFLVARGTIKDVISGAQYTALLLYFPWKVRLYTFFVIVPEWVRLLVWPAHLSADYSPQAVMVPLRWTWGQLPGVTIVVLLAVSAVVSAWRWRASAFALGWLAVTLAVPSGLLIATGFLLAERTLFTPSVGAVLLAGACFDWLRRRTPREGATPAMRLATVGVLMAVLAAGVWRSAGRQRVWKDNETLFHQIVEDVPLSYRGHIALGGHYMETGRLHLAEKELRKAIHLFPVDPDGMDLLAGMYVANDMCAPAVPLLQKVLWMQEMRVQRLKLGYNTPMSVTRARLARCYAKTAQYDSARALARRSVAQFPRDSIAFRYPLQVADSALGRLFTDAR